MKMARDADALLIDLFQRPLTSAEKYVSGIFRSVCVKVVNVVPPTFSDNISLSSHDNNALLSSSIAPVSIGRSHY